MKQLKCEMCGSTDLLKQDGVFVCQTCGCKYSVEEARKMMVEGTVEVTGTVKVDNSAAIDNYLSMAKNALKSFNNEEAEGYANKIIELEPTHSEAWEIKGESAGWQSKTNNNRIGESVSAWLNAINYAKEEDKSELRSRIAQKFCNLFLAILSLHTGNFAKIHDDEYAKSVILTLDNGIYYMNDLTVKGGIHFNRAPIYDDVARKMNSCAVDGYKDVLENIGTDYLNMSQYDRKRFVDSCDSCLKILYKAVEYVRDAELGKTLCDNIVVIGEEGRTPSFWCYGGNAWNAHTDSVHVYKNLKKFFETGTVDTVVNALSNGRKEIENELGKKAYWAEHQTEKQTLETEKSNLYSRIDVLKKEIENSPILSKISEIKNEINSLINKKSGLGLFKIKEKKEIQEHVYSLETELKQLEIECANQKKSLENEIDQCQKRIREIDDEFNKERGSVSTEEAITVENAIRDGKIALTPKELVEHLSDELPKDYEFGKLSPFVCSFHSDWDDCLAVVVERKGVGSSGILIVMQAESENDSIKSIIVQTSCEIEVDFIVLWCQICSIVIRTLFADVSRDNAEAAAAKLMLDKKTSRFVQDGFNIEYVTYKLKLENEDLSLKSMLIR